jgi:hypothetical protein
MRAASPRRLQPPERSTRFHAARVHLDWRAESVVTTRLELAARLTALGCACRMLHADRSRRPRSSAVRVPDFIARASRAEHEGDEGPARPSTPACEASRAHREAVLRLFLEQTGADGCLGRQASAGALPPRHARCAKLSGDVPDPSREPFTRANAGRSRARSRRSTRG